MKNKIKLKVRNSVELSVDSKILDSIRKVNTWFTNQKASWVLLILAAITDISGFTAVFTNNLDADKELIPIIIIGLSIGFEVAPLYIGYSICLFAYNYGKRIRKWVMAFSATSFSLAIIANTGFRILNIVLGNEEDIPTVIVMILLPLITSFMNLAVGCLSFDPLGMDMLRLSKLVKKLKLKLYQYKSIKNELEKDDSLKDLILKKNNINYSNAKFEVVASSITAKSYIDILAADFRIK